ncbi:MAG TPA: hypothetical protein VF168_07805 [Trueperaceae bacterium]
MNQVNSEPYGDDDHELLMEAAATVLLATVAADRSGPVAYFSEMTAAGTFLYEARERYPDNPLVQELFRRHEGSELRVEEDEPGGAITKETLHRDIERIEAVLRRDEVGMEFRRFLFELAQRVARASRSGWFGPRISEGEAAFLAELRGTLGLVESD